VTVSSEVGRGTVVTLYLPRARAEATAGAGETAARPTGRRRHGAVVEDSREVADVTSALLEQLGYRWCGRERREALRHLQQGIAFDLLLSDILCGLARRPRAGGNLSRALPRHAILLTSGYSDAAQARRALRYHAQAFELAALERAIEQVVGRGRERSQRRAS